DVQKTLIKQGLIHGIEVGTSTSVSPEAFSIALENNLTILANSDIHGSIESEYPSVSQNTRPATLIFAKENNQKSIVESLFNHRTIAIVGGSIWGRAELITPFLEACLTVKNLGFYTTTATESGIPAIKSGVLKIVITNRSSQELLLLSTSKYT